MNLDFTVEETPRHKVYFLARAIRTLIDPDAYSSKLINAEGERVYRIVFDEENPKTPLHFLQQHVA